MDDIKRYQKALGIVLDALEVYANPETYHAIAIIADRPAGEFADDFSKTDHPYYDRMMPGRLARATINRLAKRYGDLIAIRKN